MTASAVLFNDKKKRKEEEGNQRKFIFDEKKLESEWAIQRNDVIHWLDSTFG